MEGHKIKLKSKPSRFSHKNGKVGRNNDTFKTVPIKMEKELTSDSVTVLVSRASLMTNLI